jgi:alkylation response protein AidB-like acyl-CoA dehydrogenase
MWVEPDPDQRELVAEVDELLGTGPGAEQLARLQAAGPETDPRPLFALLGEHRLLAVHWPESLGGRDMRMLDHVAVAERLGQVGVPDVAHLVTIQAVGSTLLLAGSSRQRETIAPLLARGEALASLLYSEPQAGSDLAALRTRAEQVGPDEYRLWGEKVWSPYTPWSRFALCPARTRSGSSPYDGITLFLIELNGEGVEIAPLPVISPDPLHMVRFEGAPVGTGSVVGELHRGWSLLLRSISLERAGFDYLSRAQRWFPSPAAAAAAAPPHRRTAVATAGLDLAERLADARVLSYAAAASARGLEMDEGACALAKVAASEVAQRIAWWAHGVDAQGLALEELAEAAAVTISGGATEVLLDAIGAELEPGGAEADDALGRLAAFERIGWELGEPPAASDGTASDDGDAARLRQAGFLTGVARRAQAQAVAYAQNRKLGGGLLIERQAVAHRLARAALRLELARARLARASHPRASVDSWLALADAVELALTGARDAVQVHGAVGLAEPRVMRAFELANRAIQLAGSPDELRAAASRGWVEVAGGVG